DFRRGALRDLFEQQNQRRFELAISNRIVGLRVDLKRFIMPGEPDDYSEGATEIPHRVGEVIRATKRESLRIAPPGFRLPPASPNPEWTIGTGRILGDREWHAQSSRPFS